MQISIEQFLEETQERLEPFRYVYELGDEFRQETVGVRVYPSGEKQRINLYGEIPLRTTVMHSLAINDIKEIDKDAHGSMITYRLVGHDGSQVTLY